MNQTPIYLDYHATTPLDPRVAEKMQRYLMTSFGNPSSVSHEFGVEAEWAVREAKQEVAKLVDASPLTVYFTSGSTESINLALQGYVHRHYQGTPLKVATLPLEHKATLMTWEHLANKGLVELILLSVDQYGQVDLNEIETLCREGLNMLTVMGANNEIGTIYPIQQIAAIAYEHKVVYFCDASQAAGKFPIHFKDWKLGFLALTGHKIYGPKGCGVLLMRKDIQIEPLFYGGAQQKGIRPGTLNVPAIVGLGETCRLRNAEMHADEARIAALREDLRLRLHLAIPELQVNGDPEQHLAGNLHISIPGIPNDALVAHFRSELAVSTGSACSAGGGSHVLQALNMPCEHARGAVRIGLGKYTTEQEIHRAADLIIDAYHKVKAKLTV